MPTTWFEREFSSETHHVSCQCVAKSEETGIPMNELSFEQLKAIDSRFEADIAEAFVYEMSVERRRHQHLVGIAMQH